MPFLEHVWQLFAFVLILVAPIPASLTATSRARCNGPHVLAHTTLVLLTWWCALQCAIGIVLGSMDLLRLPFLLTAEIALLSTGLLLLRRGRDSIGGLRAAVETRVAGVADRRIFLLLGVLIAMGTTLVCRAVTFPVTNFDSLAYHLPHVAEWYQSGSLVALSSMRQIARYPFNWEVLQALFVLPFGEDFLVALPNALACLVLGVAVYRLSVQLGATPVVALTAAGLCMTVPDVTQQLRTGLVDVAFAAFFVASLCFVVESHRSGRVGSLAPFLLSVGLLLGIKASALPYASILLLLWIAPRQWWSPSFGAWRDRKSTPRLMTVGSLWRSGTRSATFPFGLLASSSWLAMSSMPSSGGRRLQTCSTCEVPRTGMFCGMPCKRNGRSRSACSRSS
jgi:hypothetical protein